MDDQALSALLKRSTDAGDVTAPAETVSIVMRTIAIAECLKALAELYFLAPLEVLDQGLNGREGRKEG